MPEPTRPTTKPPTPESEIRAYTIGELERHDAPVTLVSYDPEWPRLYEREAARIRAALGDRLIRIEHTGSTSVPGLAAKPIIDITLVVADSADEASYVPQLEAAGYVLRIREPDWFEHRLFKGPDTNTNIHTFSAGSPEIERMVAFRDWLRSNDDDRDLYERTKRDLASRDWQYVQHYADAKTEVVEAIMARALAPHAGP
ncbi:MAG TPA: GrpB family protein [Candidatus Limnocylindrales bacterium]